MIPRSTISSRAERQRSPMEKSKGQSLSQSPQSAQELIILFAL